MTLYLWLFVSIVMHLCLLYGLLIVLKGLTVFVAAVNALFMAWRKA